VTNAGNPYFSGHVGEVYSTHPMNYSISSIPCPSNGFLTWAPGATSTPISSDNILTSRRSQTADHHMNAASGRSISSYPVMNTGVQVTFPPKEMPSSGPEIAAGASTLPSEAIREAEFTGEMRRARANSQTPRPTIEGKFWFLYLIMRDVIASEVFIKGDVKIILRTGDNVIKNFP
jgi:hypothetical protein